MGDLAGEDRLEATMHRTFTVRGDGYLLAFWQGSDYLPNYSCIDCCAILKLLSRHAHVV